MIIESINIKNFRSIKKEKLECSENLTALVGANGSGKSSFLHALEFFFDSSLKLEHEDFHGGNKSEEIVISLTFSQLSDEARSEFSEYIKNDKLVVERVFKCNNKEVESTIHGFKWYKKEFNDIFTKSAIDAKNKYNKIKQAYPNFPDWTKHDAIKKHLNEWIQQNESQCERPRDDGKFFKLDKTKNRLKKYIHFLYVPAVRNAIDDAHEGKDSILTKLIDLVIRDNIETTPEIIKFRQTTKEKYSKILKKTKTSELSDTESEMKEILRDSIPSADIKLKWDEYELKLDLPKIIAELLEDGYQTDVTRTGHGLQRVFIMTLLQQLSLTQANSSNANKQTKRPNIILVVEEPELYQHPTRQRHLAKMFRTLTKKNSLEKTQMIYSTHSPYFVGVDRINEIRLLRKISNKNEKAMVTKIYKTTLKDIARELNNIYNKSKQKFSEETTRARLQSFIHPWINEGFFANIVVLVEGDSDRTALLAVGEYLNFDFEKHGFAIIPCSGKNNLDRLAIIFSQLKIPVYVLWDSDHNSKNNGQHNQETNQALLNIMKYNGKSDVNIIEEKFACFKTTLNEVLKDEIGNKFEEYLNKNKNKFAINTNQPIKNPVIMRNVIIQARKNGHTSKTLEKIVERIFKLKK